MNKGAPENSPTDYPRLNWRIGVAMAEAGVRTNRELKKRLAAAGYQTSEAKLCRLRKVDLRSIDVELLAALCAVLTTSPNELLAPSGGWPRPATAPPLSQARSNKAGNPGIERELQNVEPLTATPKPAPMLGPRIRAVTSTEMAAK